MVSNCNVVPMIIIAVILVIVIYLLYQTAFGTPTHQYVPEQYHSLVYKPGYPLWYHGDPRTGLYIEKITLIPGIIICINI